MEARKVKLFDYFSHPRDWTPEVILVWLVITAAVAPLGVIILVLSYRLDRVEKI
uniref:Uncharacterized protein n=1 Tax=viral metagenome TaxID=1070528 RepID=A0A6H2A1U4_9ZZZZ